MGEPVSLQTEQRVGVSVPTVDPDASQFRFTQVSSAKIQAPVGINRMLPLDGKSLFLKEM
jgi:hypothetical protein